MGRANRLGFTLIEAIISLAIFCVVALAILSTFVIGRRTWLIGEAQVSIQQAARNAVDYMTRELTFSSPLQAVFTSGASTITFKEPASVDASGTITWSSDIIYWHNMNSRQIIRTFSGQDTILANDVEDLKFFSAGSRGIQIQVTTKRPTYEGRDVQYSLTSLLYLRNE